MAVGLPRWRYLLERLHLDQRLSHQAAENLCQQSTAFVRARLRVCGQDKRFLPQFHTAEDERAIVEGRAEGLEFPPPGLVLHCQGIGWLFGLDPIPERRIFLAKFRAMTQG